ncbi:MAG: sugar phosphate isomerase/epimerase [Armatimonadetes bacterium CG_4_10_14_0_8_um_filter_66_14]|nr:MAG: sugar phosphate isomerase/epimerase [Armatimonadetes bacterium CG_4_10_14_0_8_um_filter_66_14]
MNIPNRRDFLKLSAAGAVATVAGASVAAETKKKRIPIAVQLYSVRQVQDPVEVLEQVGKIGYEGVEFAGYFGKSANELAKLLDANGLKCCGTHTGWGSIQGDELKKTAEFNLTMGNRNLVVPGGIPTGQTAQSWIDCGKKFAEIAEKAKELGVRVGYHNHSHEFHKVEDKIPWELLFDNAGPEVIMQVDTGNCLGGGGDPIAYIRKYSGQTKTIHLKEHGKERGVIGEGTVKWTELFDACETVGGTEWYIVEQESYPDGKTPFDAIRMCFENLKKMGK